MSFTNLLERLHEEGRDAGRSLAAPLERLPRTVPMVSALRAAAIEALFHDVARSRELADRAVLLALDLAPGSYERPLVTQARVQALKDLATVRRHAADLAGAHEALDEAALLADEEPALGHDRAVLGLARALTFSQEQAYDEAIECLREAAQSFVEFGDERRLGQCRHTEGMTQYRVGRYNDAITSFNDALKLVGEDLRTTTSLLTNRGFAELESGQLAAAAATFGAALPLAIDLGAAPEHAGIIWGLARLQLVRGEYTRAITQLQDVWTRYVTLGMPEEQGLALLDLAETHLGLLDERAARTAVEAAIEAFSRATIPSRLQTAVAYLRELASSPVLSAPPLRRVRTYIALRPPYAFLS